MNLLNHKKYFGIEAEWHFFATSHGKGACDIGGCVKRNAYCASLQNRNSKKITNTTELYKWATEFFNKIYFGFRTVEEFENHKKKLESRFATAKTVKNTRAYHCYKPINNKKIKCKVFSAANSDDVQQILK